MNNGIDGISIIIPSLDPSDTLVDVVKGLIETGFSDIIVIDDGSRPEYTEPFAEVEKLPECVVVRHPRNMGKGEALKTAFDFCLKNRPALAGVITVDADGQHKCEDAVKCALALKQNSDSVIMGVRDFKQRDVPARNSLGNRVTALAFRVLFGIRLRDTQTGLRGISAQHFTMMTEVRGSRFEYETNMLLEIEQRHIPFLEVEIETVYEEGSNERSHYRPFVDSIIIFSRIFKYSISSIMSFVVDIGLFWLAMRYLAAFLVPWSIPACTVIARIFSSFFNFNFNRRLVFRRRKAYGSHLKRYSVLSVLQATVSACFVWLLAWLLTEAGTAGIVTLLKVAVDTMLFFLSYHIQQKWVFAK